MKVIQVSTFFHPSVGGVERQVEEIAHHLSRSDIEVEVYTTDATHGREKRMQRLEETFRGVKVNRFRYQIALGYFFRFAVGLLWKALWAKYDVIHVHNMHDGHLLGLILIRLIRRKRLIITGHNPYAVTDEKRGGLLHWFVGFFEWWVKLLRFGIDGYIALLNSEKQEVMRRFKIPERKIVVVPNGIQEIYYQPNGDAQKFYQEWEIDPTKWDLIVGAACRMNYVKGIQNLEMAADKLPRVLFIFAGGDSGYLDSLTRIYRENKNVIFTKQYIPADEMINFYQAIDLFLLPSIYEPFGMTMIEAMAQGKMVLATNHGGPAEIITDQSGRLLDPHDQTTWLQAIKYFTQHKDEVTQIGSSAQKFATKYQWSRVIEGIKDAYKQFAG